MSAFIVCYLHVIYDFKRRWINYNNITLVTSVFCDPEFSEVIELDLVGKIVFLT